MWFSHLLKPYIHYVPVKSDLSDLIEKIQWCRDNDEKCKEEFSQEALKILSNNIVQRKYIRLYAKIENGQMKIGVLFQLMKLYTVLSPVA